MKKTILTILILAFCVSISGAGITDKLRAVIAAKNAPAGGGAPTYSHHLKCEDDAATTVVVNDGTEADWITLFIPDSRLDTEDFNDPTVYKVDSGAFYFDGGRDGIESDLWDDEKFELKFWIRLDNSAPGGGQYEQWFQIGDTDFSTDQNEVMVWRTSSSDEICVGIKGNNASATQKERCTNDWSPSADTWYMIRLNIDATIAGTWTVVLEYSTNGTDFTELTFAAGDWNTGYAASWDNSHAFFGASSNAFYYTDARIDEITVEPK